MNEGLAYDFALPAGLTGRFAVVKLWPELKTAEDECIARLKIAAGALGLRCVEVHADGRLIDAPDTVVTQRDVDFVLHLHYDTPKFYDVFSFVALWNPLQFYHEWGYQRTSRNLLSHDDFVSCSSSAADDHVARMIRHAATHLPASFNLYHSIADIARPPSLGDQKLFYVGINWEAVNGGKSRHQSVLKRLDQTGLMRIYGPKVFLKTEVWKGYQSYVREIPFDGVSMIDEISKAGIALVLSSPAHKASELMSNRLFESVAAGALVICDENRFASKYFGDALLYIDTRASVDTICADVERHIAWAKAHPQEALAKIAKAQQIFREKFSLVRNVRDLYQGFEARKRALLERQGLRQNGPRLRVGMYLLFPEFSAKNLRAHVASVATQAYEAFEPVLVVDGAVSREHGREIADILAESRVPIRVAEIDFHVTGPTGTETAVRPIGAVLTEIIERARDVEALVFVAPNERLFANHLQVLAGSLMRDPERQCATTSVIIKHGADPVHTVSEHIEFGHLNPATPIGFARFIFRVSGLPDDLRIILPYLYRKPLAAMLGESRLQQEIPSTVIIDAVQEFPRGPWNEGMENEILGDYSLKSFAVYRGCIRDLPSLAPHPVPVVTTPMTRYSSRWFKYQMTVLREKGVFSRVGVLKERLDAKRSD